MGVFFVLHVPTKIVIVIKLRECQYSVFGRNLILRVIAACRMLVMLVAVFGHVAELCGVQTY